MTRFSTARRTALGFVAASLTLVSAPAFAKEAKGIVVPVAATTLKDAASRMCMPKTILPKPVDKSLPGTICQTRDEWAANGVTFVAR